MKLSWFSLGMTVAIALGALGMSPKAAKAEATGYYCGMAKGAPATMAKTSTGTEVAMIVYKSEYFNNSGYTPERRCKEVSQRFDSMNSQGKLRLSFMTTGRKNGQNVVCVAREQGGGCSPDGLLFTLRNDQKSVAVLRDLVEWAKYQTGPIYQTEGREYYSIDEILKTASQNIESRVEPAVEAPQAPPSESSGSGGNMFAE